ILVPLGIYFVLKLIPDDVMSECRGKARALSSEKRPTNYLAATIIIAIWILLALLSVHLLLGILRD
ncbi:MAG: hypothetical protein HYY47_03440, partial [Deltaproteobacteria bacterium]|nr:hypothetical protein [Deltaproteobacteria bacterium]